MTTKAAIPVLASVNVPAATTRAAPVASSTIDTRTHAGGDLAIKITNGSSAPSVAATVVVQVSHDGADWTDYHTFSGDTAPSSVTPSVPWIDQGIMYLRVIAFGNATNAVTVQAYLQAVTAA